MADNARPDVHTPVGTGADEARLADDAASRAHAVDPRVNVALEASAGTGKTRVLVDRYVNLLRAGVDPRHILAITFTRKAAAEMRQRVLATLDALQRTGALDEERAQALRDRRAEIAISTIDAFCMGLLREFPLEADVDPGFEITDETDTPRLISLAIDRALRAARARAVSDDDMALVLSRMSDARLRTGLDHLLTRRLVAAPALERTLRRLAGAPDARTAAAQATARFARVFAQMDGGLERLLASGPDVPAFGLLHDALAPLGDTVPVVDLPVLVSRVRRYFLTQEGTPRLRLLHSKDRFRDAATHARHRDAVKHVAPAVLEALTAYEADLNALLTRGLGWIFTQAADHYRRLLDEHGMLDFTDALLRALTLLRQMDEFSRSRYRLEARYQHVLVDEFQDTSRAQWELVALLVQAWGAGLGVAAEGALPPSIFIVGDRKQSIYGFRDAEVSVLDEASRFIEGLRAERGSRRAIARSFRSVPGLLAFVNDVCEAIDKVPERADAFRYDTMDRFPRITVDGVVDRARGAVVSLAVGADADACARLVAADIARRLQQGDTVRDRDTGVARAVRPGDIAILFRTRSGHREYERQLSALSIPSYVYKGLGFFESDEIRDVVALIDGLAAPDLDLTMSAVLRSRLVRLSDEALKRLAPDLAAAVCGSDEPPVLATLDADDAARLRLARTGFARWLPLVDRLPPADVLDLVLHESAYAAELAGPGLRQARENLKKVRALVRRIQNRGYATMARVSARLAQLRAGDDSNAVIDAIDAVNLMTIHAAKGLEFPVVYLVNLQNGAGGSGDPVTLLASPHESEPDTVVVEGLGHDVSPERRARRLEDSKRLLYVALTRARDHLCLAAVLDAQGRVPVRSGSLAAVLPADLRAVFEQAAAMPGGGTLEWTGRGSTHALQVLGAVADARPLAPLSTEPPRPYDAAPLPLSWQRPLGVTAAIGHRGAGDAAGRAAARPRAEAATRGSAFHAAIAAGVLQTVDADARADVLARCGAGRDAGDDTLRLVERLRDDPRLQALLGHPWQHEVPFSMRRRDGVVLRGVIDVLVRAGRPVVLEFKTGGPMPEHEAQLRVYLEAASALVGEPAEGQLVYVSPDGVRFLLVSA